MPYSYQKANKAKEEAEFIYRRLIEAVDLLKSEPGIKSEQRYQDVLYSLRSALGLA